MTVLTSIWDIDSVSRDSRVFFSEKEAQKWMACCLQVLTRMNVDFSLYPFDRS